MNKRPQNPYFFAGVTAFLVIAAAILVFFAVFVKQVSKHLIQSCGCKAADHSAQNYFSVDSSLQVDQDCDNSSHA